MAGSHDLPAARAMIRLAVGTPLFIEDVPGALTKLERSIETMMKAMVRSRQLELRERADAVRGVIVLIRALSLNIEDGLAEVREAQSDADNR